MTALRSYGFVLALLASLFSGTTCWSQIDDTASIFSRPVQMDTFTIKSGFDINAFIRRVKNDTTFYKAFRSMHLKTYTAQNRIDIYDIRNNSIIAGQRSKTRQLVKNHCRTTIVLNDTTTGDFYNRKGDYNYYTAELFAYLFLTKGTICNETDIVAGNLSLYGGSRIEKNKYQLKQLIFNPGSRVRNIPFMADRASIFDPGEAEKYDFKISQEKYAGQDCYVFNITPRKGYESKVIYNQLTTWFRKGDYKILARDYSLSYSTLLYDFDVVMKVRTTIIDGKTYPSYISYNGNWHVLTKKRERVQFKVNIDYDDATH